MPKASIRERRLWAIARFEPTEWYMLDLECAVDAHAVSSPAVTEFDSRSLDPDDLAHGGKRSLVAPKLTTEIFTSLVGLLTCGLVVDEHPAASCRPSSPSACR